MNVRRHVYPIIGLMATVLMALAALAVPQSKAAAQGPPAGSQQWVSILCKFSDFVAVEPKTADYFQQMYFSSEGLDAYWQDVSDGHINLAGSSATPWMTLGNPRDFYRTSSDLAERQTALFNECAALGDPSTDFDNVAGINLVFNADMTEFAWQDLFTLRTVTLDGSTRTMPVNYIFPGTFYTMTVFAYGMGHGMGMTDSTSSAVPLADNVWDLMDVWNFHQFNENEFCPFAPGTVLTTFVCSPPHPIAFHKDEMGWIDAARKFVYDDNGGPETITLERAASAPGTGYLMAVIGEAPNYLTIEARNEVGFDSVLPASGVIIHHINTTVATPAALHGSDGTSYSGNPNTIWLPGETYTDNNLEVHIDSATATGYVITISRPIFDSNEPANNATATAPLIPYGSSLNSVIQPVGDEDIYRFSGTAGDVIKMDLDAFESGSHLNPTLALLDAGGNQIAFMDDTPSFRQDPLIYFTLPATGTYYLRVRDRDHPAEGGWQYWYILNLQNVTANDPHEPNNTQAAATPLVYGANLTDAYIGTPGDEDVYRFSGTAGDGITIAVRASATGSQMLPDLILRNGGGIVATAREWQSGDGFLSVILPETTTYYIHVKDQWIDWRGGTEFGYPLELTANVGAEPTEPNNTRQTATNIVSNAPVNAYIGLPGDLDYYRFNGNAGDNITANIDAESLDSALDSWLGLYNSAGTLIELNDNEHENTADSLLTFTLPSAGTYYLRVQDAAGIDSTCGLGCDYALTLTGATAPPPPPPPTAAFTGTPLSGPAPLVVAFTDQSTGSPTAWVWEFGDFTASTQRNPNHTYTTPGIYTVTLTATNAQGSDSEIKTGYVVVGNPLPSPSLYVSSLTAGTVGGVAATPQDILFRDGAAGTWAMYFDGSDVGVTKPLTAFARLANGDLLLVLKANQSLPGVGTVTPWDIVRFTPTSLGANTAGTFNWYLDGSDVALTTSGEKLDALDVLAGGRVLISTTGTLSVPKAGGGTLKTVDEDLAALTPTSLGATTAGTWALYFDGSTVTGLAAEDLVGAHVDETTGDIYVAILGSFSVGGVSGNGKDVLRLHPAGGGYTTTLYWRGPTHGFNLNLGGIEAN